MKTLLSIANLFQNILSKKWQASLSEKGQASSALIIAFVAVLVISVLNITKFPPQYFIMFFAGLFVFLVAFLKTNFALGILIFSMLLSPEIGIGKLADRAIVIRFDDIFLIVIFLGWIAKLAIFKELNLLKRTPLNATIFWYVFICIVSTAMMLIEGRGTFRQSIFYFLKYFEYFLLYFLVVNNIESMSQVKHFVFLIIVTAAIVSCYGLYSYFATGVRATAPFEGLEGEANTLAGYLVFAMSLVMGLLLYSDSQKLKMPLLIVLVLAAIALIFTLSRSGWLSFLVMYISFVFLSKKYKPALILVLVVIITLAPVLAPKVAKERVSSTFIEKGGRAYKLGGKKMIIDESGAARLDAWGVAFKILVKKPVLGRGIPGGFVVDNQYGRVMMETGVVGFILFLSLLFRIFQLARDAIVHTKDDAFAQSISIGFMAAFFGILFHCLSAATFILIRIMEPFWFLMAIIVLLPRLVKKETEEQAPQAIIIQGT